MSAPDPRRRPVETFEDPLADDPLALSGGPSLWWAVALAAALVCLPTLAAWVLS